MKLLALGILCLSVSVYGFDWIKRFRTPPPLIDGIQEPLQNSLSLERVYYSSPNTTNNYKSSTQYITTGMTHLYYVTDLFIDLMGKDQVLPPGVWNISKVNKTNFNNDNNIINNVNDNKFDDDIDENGDLKIMHVSEQLSFLAKHYGIILLVILLAVLFIVAMPAIGISFCCCRHVGRCGVRSEPFDKRYDPFRRYCYGFCLSFITMFITFGVVWSFTTNEYLEEGIQTFPDHLRDSLKDTDLYLNNTKEEVNSLFIVNYGELESTISRVLDGSGKIVLDELGLISKATSLLNLTTIVDGLSAIQTDLQSVDQLTKLLQNNALQLAQGLKETRDTLLQKMSQCSGEMACQEFLNKFNIRDVSLEANFSLLPDVTYALQNVSKIISSDIKDQVEVCKREYEDVQENIQDAVQDFIPPIKDRMRLTGESVSNVAHRINGIITRIEEHVHSSTHPHIDSGEELIDRFSSYRYYVCFMSSMILCLVTVSLSIGLLCGFCGSRPAIGYPNDCCNRGTGSRYLIIAVWIMFLSSSLLMLVSVFYFITGVTAEKVVCQTLRNPQNSYLFQMLDNHLDVNKYYEQNTKTRKELKERIHLKDIVRNCHKNQSLYEVLHLENQIVLNDILSYQRSFEIDKCVDELVVHIQLDRQLTILTPRARYLLEDMAQSLGDINFPAYTNVLDERITSIDLMQVAASINETAQLLSPHLSSIKHSLLNQAMYLKTHQDTLVSTMVGLSKRLESTAHQLQRNLKFNHTSLREAIDKLLTDVADAQKFLKLEGRTIVRKIANEFGTNITRLINDYFERAVKRMRNDVGRCGPLSQAYNATLVAGCNRILQPFNGFWMSLAITALLFVPGIILAVLLSTLYQKTDSYPGPLVEAEYYYDICGDHVPLNKPKLAVQAGGRTRAIEPEVQNDLIALSSSNSSSACKNSEYDRPPPYYYPKPTAATAAPVAQCSISD